MLIANNYFNMKEKNKILFIALMLLAIPLSTLSLNAEEDDYSHSESSTASSSEDTYSNGSIRYAFNEFDPQNIKFSDRIGYMSEHVYRGALRGRSAFFNDLQAMYQFDELDTYLGLYTVFPNSTNNRYANEIDPYVGAKSEIYDGVFLDGGYTMYRYARSTAFHNKRNTHEVFVGATADYIANPGLYVFYDISLRQIVLEASVGHSFDLEEYLNLRGFSLEAKGSLGHVRARRWYGNSTPRRRNSYNYVMGNTDLVYALNDRTQLRTGFQVALNSDKKAGPANIFGQHTSTVGWGISMNVDF